MEGCLKLTQQIQNLLIRQYSFGTLISFLRFFASGHLKISFGAGMCRRVSWPFSSEPPTQGLDFSRCFTNNCIIINFLVN